MELRHLRYFVTIAEERSFTRAAERLWVAQPGLSAQIRRLERELAVQLFVRHPRGVELTSAGAIFLERARTALRAADAAEATGRDIGSGIAGSIKIGLASGAQWGQTPLLLERFTQESAGIDVSVLVGYGGALWHELRGGRLDAIIAPCGFLSADLNRLPLGDEPWVALIGPTHRLADDAGPVLAEDLEGQRIAVAAHRDAAQDDRAITEVLTHMGVTGEMVRSAPGPGLCRHVADGSVLVLTTAPQEQPNDVLVRRLDCDLRLDFMLLWRDDVPSPAVSAFVATAACCAQECQPLSLEVAA